MCMCMYMWSGEGGGDVSALPARARRDPRPGVRHPRECKDGARALNGAAGDRVGTVPRAAISVGRSWRVDGSGCARACASLSLCVAGSGRDQTHLSEESGGVSVVMSRR